MRAHQFEEASLALASSLSAVDDVAPVDGFVAVTKMVVGELLQPFQFGVDGGSAGEVDVESGLLGIVIGDAIMNALFNQEAKLFVRIAYQLAGYYNGHRRNTKEPCHADYTYQQGSGHHPQADS